MEEYMKEKIKINPGDRFHSLEVLEYIGLDTNKHQVYQVKCNCGKIKNITKSELGRTKTCGCIMKKNGNQHFRFRGYDNIGADYFSHIKSGAKKRNLEFDITIEYINNLLVQQNFTCALSKIPINTGSRLQGYTASLDRIDNTKGYIPGNVQWVHRDINYMKQDFTMQEFVNYCQLVSKNYTSVIV